VAVEIDGFEPEDNYFHLAPGASRTVRLVARAGAGVDRPKGVVQALNGDAPVSVPARG
jgi:beta-mannosidase